MIEIRINKEIGNFEPKFVGPFTMRQTACLVCALPICYLILKYLSPIITADLAGFFCAIPAGVAALFGWVKPYGMRTEKFIQSVFINKVIAPANRRYKTVNTHDKMLTVLANEDTEELQRESGKKKEKFSVLPAKRKVYPGSVK